MLRTILVSISILAMPTTIAIAATAGTWDLYVVTNGSTTKVSSGWNSEADCRAAAQGFGNANNVGNGTVGVFLFCFPR
jgi:hypothetical protein